MRAPSRDLRHVRYTLKIIIAFGGVFKLPENRVATQNGLNHAGWGWRLGLRSFFARRAPAVNPVD